MEFLLVLELTPVANINRSDAFVECELRQNAQSFQRNPIFRGTKIARSDRSKASQRNKVRMKVQVKEGALKGVGRMVKESWECPMRKDDDDFTSQEPIERSVEEAYLKGLRETIQ
ncbi:hypothetical protein HZH66_010009 [Vespula vulgaris]|uniref:Uncharacterized protein n=1 Tax=Vespula vulgaris TaxID=7454 RepID=A0A834JKN8_VESVU|nr:hypothetical protein HZH66_010009 [Vespula vulgaris]